MTRLVFDFDSIKFKAACAAEERSVLVTHKQSGDSWEFKTRTEFHGRDKKSNFLLEYSQQKDDLFTVDDFVFEDKQRLRSFIKHQDIVDSLIGGICKTLSCKDYYGYLGRGASFREAMSHMKQYKGQRSELVKPLLIDKVADYISKQHKGKFVEGLESDDWVSIDSQNAFDKWKKSKSDDDKLVLLSVDKDSRTHPGWLFNYDTMTSPLKVDGFGKLYEENEGTPNGWGRIFFYYFILNGDMADNYSPTALCNVRYGKKSAYKDLKDCKTDKEALQSVVNRYKTWYPSPVDFISWRGEQMTYSWLDVMQEIWDMAFMLKYEGQRIVVKYVLDKVGVNYE